MWKIKLSKEHKHIQKSVYYFDCLSFHKHMSNTVNYKFPKVSYT